MVKLLRYSFVALVFVVVVLGAAVMPRASFETDLMALVPPGAEAPAVAEANARLSNAVTNRVRFLLSSPNWATTQQGAERFMARLRACDCTQAVTSAPDGDTFTQLGDLYLQHAPVLLSQKDRVLLQQGQAEALLKSALRELSVRNAQAPPLNGADSTETLEEGDAVEQLELPAFARDPLTSATDFLEGLREQAMGRGSVENGILYFTDDRTSRRYAFIAAELTASPHALSTQLNAMPVIDDAVVAYVTAVPDGEVLRLGELFAAGAALEQTQWEFTWIAAGTLLGVVVLLLLTLRSVWLLVLALLPVMLGGATGLVATVATFGGMHLVALLLGITLVGISVDYSLHFLCRRRATGADWHAGAALLHLFPGLTFGLITSSAAYLGFLFTGMEALQQIAVFSSAGLLAAYLMVVGFYPALLARPDRKAIPEKLQRALTQYLVNAREQLRRLKHPEIGLPLLALAAISIWQLDFNDDVDAMQPPVTGTEQEAAQFRQLADGMANSEYLLVRAADQETLLQRLEQLKAPLAQLEEERVMADHINLSDWVPSRATQQTNAQLLNEQLVASGLLERYFAHLGVPAERQQVLLDAYRQPGEHWLTLGQVVPLLEDLLDRPLYFRHRGAHYSLILFEGLRDFRPLQGLAASAQGVMWVDREVSANRLISDYRQRISWVLAGAYLFTFLVLLVRYGWRGALEVLAPPLLASVLTLMLLAWMSLGVTLLTVVGLLLVLGVGIDYTLFLRESDGRDCGSLIAIGLAAATTTLVFALLMLSATHAIFSFGLTVCLGISLTFLLTPLALGADPDYPSPGEFCR